MARDARKILESDTLGPSHEIKLTSPSGVSETFKGWSNDISSQIDPDTGMMVAGRTSTVAISRVSLAEKGMPDPTGISDARTKPWQVEFFDVLGQAYKFKVSRQLPDRGIGVVVLQLELLK